MIRKLLAVGLFVSSLVAAAGCGPDYPNCDSDEDCHAGEFCVNNLCVGCREDGDCPVGQGCREGACRDIPGYCDAQRPCPGGQVCRANHCSACTTDAECGPGAACFDGVCRSAEACDAGHPCPAGEECVRGYCRPIPPQAGPQECQFTPVYFDFDRDSVRRDQRAVVQTNRACMTEHGRAVRLTGSCDERGTEEYNMALGQRRADAVRRYLVDLGVPRASISGTQSRGKVDARHCYEESCWQQDRRVDFRD
ncbi:MAG: OmpA family protein [Deltaproteobacteria bacterium]|nr:OmpA family protein [Deltaproteobacteria bacterium]